MVPVSGTGQIKTGGTGFPKPVVPISASGAQIGAQRSEWKKVGLGKVEGDAVMLTPCSVCAKKAGEGRSTCEANLQAATSMGKQFRPWNGSNELGNGWRTRRGRCGWKESTPGGWRWAQRRRRRLSSLGHGRRERSRKGKKHGDRRG